MLPPRRTIHGVFYVQIRSGSAVRPNLNRCLSLHSASIPHDYPAQLSNCTETLRGCSCLEPAMSSTPMLPDRAIQSLAKGAQKASDSLFMYGTRRGPERCGCHLLFASGLLSIRRRTAARMDGSVPPSRRGGSGTGAPGATQERSGSDRNGSHDMIITGTSSAQPPSVVCSIGSTDRGSGLA